MPWSYEYILSLKLKIFEQFRSFEREIVDQSLGIYVPGTFNRDPIPKLKLNACENIRTLSQRNISDCHWNLMPSARVDLSISDQRWDFPKCSPDVDVQWTPLLRPIKILWLQATRTLLNSYQQRRRNEAMPTNFSHQTRLFLLCFRQSTSVNLNQRL